MHLHSVAKIRNFCLGMFSSPGLAHSCLQPLQRQHRCQDPFRTHNVPVLAAQLLLSSSADPRKCRLTPQPLTAHSASNLLCCQSRPTAPPQPLGGVTPPCPLCHGLEQPQAQSYVNAPHSWSPSRHSPFPAAPSKCPRDVSSTSLCPESCSLH